MPSKTDKKKKKNGTYPIHLAAVVAVVALATLYLAQKVEMTQLAGELGEAQRRTKQLEKERTKLKVAIALKKRHDTIVSLARERLAMVSADGNVTNLVWEYAEDAPRK